MSSVAPLISFRDRPFELLLELERRCVQAAAGRGLETGAQTEWVGVAYRIGQHLFVTPRQQVREIMTYQGVTRIPGSKVWLKGLANVRGQLLPIIDMHEFFGGEEMLPGRATRVIAVNHNDIPAGLLVDEVRGFRRFSGDEMLKGEAPVPAYTPFMTGRFERGEESWHVMDLTSLVESQAFLQAAE